jgi:hypothetical protein
MSLSSPEAGQGGHFVPVQALPAWSEAMRHAVRAQRCGQMLQALVLYREALEVARQALDSTSEAQAESRLSAFVSSALCLAALRVDDGSTTLATAVLADAHTSLLAIVVREPQASAWRKAAIWHSHDTHEALLQHLQEHGTDPQVERALRAGCVSLNAGSVARH